MLGIKIEFGFDELPAEPEDTCTRCHLVIEEVKYCAYLQIGDDSNYIAQLCEKCYTEE